MASMNKATPSPSAHSDILKAGEGHVGRDSFIKAGLSRTWPIH